ncbi:hypothetical protein FGW37_31545 [Streptomyces rectiverticillatus]|uniref:hypothetical protein n=1 Tax=Streptomyces rectiverticillatus TaxID=173860 RepID=UPI0015C340E0|nr:hypothetical protein [Streptomyces rectiverticillatus]QLE75519.1 hypothetical protein FGW37_31545 [Streptomyces rectiverticillatus]
MRKPARFIALPAITAASLLATGCSAASGPSGSDTGAGNEQAAAARPPAAEPRLAVRAAPEGAGAPSAVARPSGSGRTAQKSSLKVASFDRSSGRAVISGPAKAPKGLAPGRTPTPSGSAGAGSSAAPEKNNQVAVGDIIASAPAPGAPDGVLAKVTKVLGKTEKGTEVNTAPATMGALLGDAKAGGSVPVDPSTVGVEPLVKGVKVSWAKTGDLHFGPKGAKLPLGNLRIDVGTSIATAKDAPASASASASGYVQLAPEVNFAYDGGGSGFGGAPAGASVSLSGDWSSQWELKGQAAASTEGKPLRLPFAKLHASPVIQVGAVPVVVNLGLTCYLQVDADGHVNVDVKEDLKGGFRVGGMYTKGKGWSPVNTSDITATSPQASVAAAGKVKATLGAEASVGLYGAVGVTADVAPYLRAEADGRATAAADGSASATGKWAAYGGLDLAGALQLQLKIFGTPIFQKPIPLGSLHKEWKLAGGEGTVSTAGRRK